jgi:hypothetical protein
MEREKQTSSGRRLLDSLAIIGIAALTANGLEQGDGLLDKFADKVIESVIPGEHGLEQARNNVSQTLPIPTGGLEVVTHGVEWLLIVGGWTTIFRSRNN